MKIRLLSVCFSLLLLSGCVFSPVQRADVRENETENEREVDRLLDAQLGLLRDEITPEERKAARVLMTRLLPLQHQRRQRGIYEKSTEEQRLVQDLNALYDSYTVTYLNPDKEDFGYEDPPWRTVAKYSITADQTLTPLRPKAAPPLQEKELFALWDQICSWLPEDALDRFDQCTFFTDGEYETLAYVAPIDQNGKRWEFGVDPVDSKEEELFLETVLHEYFHSLTLNDTQVKYTSRQTVDTYNEEGMVSLEGSYIDDFYQTFWVDYLDDCLASEDTFNFFLRHEEDFITPYSSTNPSEDISECLTYFVLYPEQEGDAVWEQKLRFFYQYPELVSFRQTVRNNLKMEP